MSDQPRPIAPLAEWSPAALRRLLFSVHWCGPWERLGRLPGGIRWFVWCDSRDRVWRARHVAAGTVPHQRWARR